MLRLALAGLAFACIGAALAQTGGLVGHWPFDGNLDDISPLNNVAAGPVAKYAQGHEGSALDFEGQQLLVKSRPELQLAPGITFDCWIYFDGDPGIYHQIVRKNEEYLLRVDTASEGGRFAFFVYMGGWEPRIRGPVPERNTWYHVVARWTGSESVLEVNGEVFRGPHPGIATPTDNPVEIGNMVARLDDLRIYNPGIVIRDRLAAMRDEVTTTPVQSTHFSARTAWDGWRAEWGAGMAENPETLRVRFADATSMLFHPALDIDVSRRPYLCLDVASPTSAHANVSFLTDVGYGSVTFALEGAARTTIIDLGASPMWTGHLQLLALSFPDGTGNEMELENVFISEKPQGKPLVYVRNLAPGRAIVRAGRDEKIIATVRGLGRDVEGVQARLAVPEGVQIVGEAVRLLPAVRYQDTQMVEWPVRAEAPVEGQATVTVSAPEMADFTKTIPLQFEAESTLTADYVPEPRPVTSPYTLLMHYCPLWKFGTHYGWNRIEDWPDRRPAIGWYDEGTPEVADWHIKYALEHGIQAFIYCWYRENWGPDVKHTLGHAIHDGLLKSRYIDRFHYCIMWENGCAKGVQSVEDMMDNLFPYWMKNYFTHPSYLVIDNKPVLFVWRPERVAGEVGGSEQVKRMFGLMREECRKQGFDGLYIIGCVGGEERGLLERMATEGWDASSAYGISGPTTLPPGRDIEGIVTSDHADWSQAQSRTLVGKKAVGALPDIVDVMVGWDPRPWHREGTDSYVAGATVEQFRQACLNAREIVEKTPGNGLDKRLVVFDNWNEFGEGHYIEPCTGYGFGFVDAIKEVFCDPNQPCDHVIPEDVALAPPEFVYAKYKEVVGVSGEPKERRIVDNVVARWEFEEDDPNLALDSSACGFHAFKQDFLSAEGKHGKGFLCQGGAVSHGKSPEFWPGSGITVELWYRTDKSGQSDQWMVNTVGAATTGYRLGMNGGRIAWQIPLTAWSHLLQAPTPAPTGKWTHVAATYDNRIMRLYVDGELVGELARGGKMAPSSATLHVGNYSAGHPRAFFDGVLDGVTIYDRALSEEEIRARAAQ